MFPSTIQAPMPGASRIKILNLTLREVSGYHNPVIRPLRPEFNGRAVNELKERIVRSGGAITATTLSGLSGGLIGIDPHARGYVPIINGWQTKRFRFSLLIQVEQGINRTVELITGYTDYLGAQNSALDHQMVFIINNVSHLNNITQKTYNGNNQVVSSASRYNLLDSSNVLSTAGYGGYINNPLYSMTPDGILLRASFNRYSNDYVLKMDTEAVTKAPTYHNSSLTSPLHATFDIIKSVNDAHSRNKLTNGTDMPSDEVVYRDAANVLRNSNSFYNQYFGNWLFNKYNTQTNMFKYSDLLMLDPTIDDPNDRRVHISYLPPNSTDSYTNYTSELGGGDIQTVKATWCANTLPSIMSRAGIRDIAFSATNVSGMNEVILSAVAMLDNRDTTTLHASIQQMLCIELLNDFVSPGRDQITYRMNVRAELFGSIRIELQILDLDDGMSAYVFPAMANSLFSPHITDNHNDTEVISSQTRQLLQDIVFDVPGQNGAVISSLGNFDYRDLDNLGDSTLHTGDPFVNQHHQQPQPTQQTNSVVF